MMGDFSISYLVVYIWNCINKRPAGKLNKIKLERRAYMNIIVLCLTVKRTHDMYNSDKECSIQSVFSQSSRRRFYAHHLADSHSGRPGYFSPLAGQVK